MDAVLEQGRPGEHREEQAAEEVEGTRVAAAPARVAQRCDAREDAERATGAASQKPVERNQTL
jgi:hypothetical protein